MMGWGTRSPRDGMGWDHRYDGMEHAQPVEDDREHEPRQAVDEPVRLLREALGEVLDCAHDRAARTAQREPVAEQLRGGAELELVAHLRRISAVSRLYLGCGIGACEMRQSWRT